MKINILKLSDKSKIPTQGSSCAAGYDLYSAEDCVIEPLSRKLVKTNIAMSIPNGYYGRIAPRSGLAFKNGIDVMAGVIDSDYRQDIGVILYNTDSKYFSIKSGDRIAQIIIEKCHAIEWEECASLDDSDRSGGFGSTGR